MFLALSGTASLSGCLHAIRGVWHEDGIRGFYRGCATNLCRTTPAAALTFTRCEDFLHDSSLSSLIEGTEVGGAGGWEEGLTTFLPHDTSCSAHIQEVRGFPREGSGGRWGVGGWARRFLPRLRHKLVPHDTSCSAHIHQVQGFPERFLFSSLTQLRFTALAGRQGSAL